MVPARGGAIQHAAAVVCEHQSSLPEVRWAECPRHSPSFDGQRLRRRSGIVRTSGRVDGRFERLSCLTADQAPGCSQHLTDEGWDADMYFMA